MALLKKRRHPEAGVSPPKDLAVAICVTEKASSEH
jgi:hypothetical protein